MYSSVEKDLISRVTRLHHGDIKVGECFNEIINFFLDNLDAIWNDLSPLLKAMQTKSKQRAKSTSEVRSQVQRAKEVIELAVPQRLTKYLDQEWVRKPLDFWETCIDVESHQTNKIRLLYTRITTSTDDTNLYRMFAAVATYHGAARFAKNWNFERYRKSRHEDFITGLIQNITGEEQIDEDERDRIRKLFETLHRAGSRWCKWAELIGGFGGFFAHPPSLARNMIEKNLTIKDLEDIAGHLRAIGMNQYTAKYNKVADSILESIEVHLDFPLSTRKRPSPNTDEGITAHSNSPGNWEPQTHQKRAKKDGTRVLAQAEVNRTEPQVTPNSQSFSALMEKPLDIDVEGHEPVSEPTSWIGHSNLTPSTIEQLSSFEHAQSPLNTTHNFEQPFSQSPSMADAFFSQSFNQDTAINNSDDFQQPFSQDPFANDTYFPQPFSHNPIVPSSSNFPNPFGLLCTANQSSAIPTEY